ncbi:MAG TPA: DUF397 domain-containing protein [Streptosporangiaceae bacterium]|nr:DUF397 domain-containing protein [Streptosporangiaceae bacterium]
MSITYKWRKSSYSAQGNTCVEVATNRPGTVAVRDSTTWDSPVLEFTSDEWREFLTLARDSS